MATKRTIDKVLAPFFGLPLTNKPIKTTKLIETYWQALKLYSDQEIEEIISDLMSKVTKFPLPVDFLKELKAKNFEKSRFVCPKCGAETTMIIEGKCQYCRAGVPVGVPRPSIKPPPDPPGIDYLLAEQVKCQKCGEIRRCIQEPPGDGPWLCRECYTGLSTDEIKLRFAALAAGDEVRDLVKEIDDIPF